LFAAANGVEVLDVRRGVRHIELDASFDLEGRLFDYRQLGQ